MATPADCEGAVIVVNDFAVLSPTERAQLCQRETPAARIVFLLPSNERGDCRVVSA
jgi:hypothetical protein